MFIANERWEILWSRQGYSELDSYILLKTLAGRKIKLDFVKDTKEEKKKAEEAQAAATESKLPFSLQEINLTIKKVSEAHTAAKYIFFSFLFLSCSTSFFSSFCSPFSLLHLFI